MLKTILVPNQTYLESLKTYVGFTDDSSVALREAHPLIAPHFEALVDDFYATIEAHPGARAAITGGAAQIARLKQSLLRWIDELFLGPHDEAYAERRARIGRIHVQTSLPQAYMFTAMDRIRVRAMDVLRSALATQPDTLRRVATALHQMLDIELAIMLETYREDLVAKNRTAERLATIGQFAAGIGHELRNPLGVVESSAFLLGQRLQQLGVNDPNINRHLDKIATEVQRSTKTINDLLELARSRQPQRKRTKAADAISHALASITLPCTIEVNVDAPAEVTLDGDSDQIGRVLTNLVINASQAMGGKGRIAIAARRMGNETRLKVSDEGPGIPVDIRHRVFEALFTTKAKGSGLGLALCRRIVEAHGGTITLDTADKGATFCVAIPDLNAEVTL